MQNDAWIEAKNAREWNRMDVITNVMTDKYSTKGTINFLFDQLGNMDISGKGGDVAKNKS